MFSSLKSSGTLLGTLTPNCLNFCERTYRYYVILCNEVIVSVKDRPLNQS